MTTPRGDDPNEKLPPKRGGGRSKPPNAGGKAYQGALEATFAVIIGVILGYWADQYFESEPIGLILGAVLGFAAMVLRLLRLGRELGLDGSQPGSQPGDDDS
jgi:F0F1-type ATP synthase assembly protein I